MNANRISRRRPTFAVFILLACLARAAAQTPIAQTPSMPPPNVAKFALLRSGLELERATRAGAFYDVTGRRAALFGYEHGAAEAWVYPLKVLDDLNVAFHLENYPLDIAGADVLRRIDVRPEATTLTYSHAAFTVRQIIYAPIEEQGIIMLFDVESVLPLTLTVSFRPHLRLAWPAGLMTATVGFDEREHYYFIGEETQKFFGIIGSPAARDISIMPYQEEPRDVPNRFTISISNEEARTRFIPVVITGSTEGLGRAKNAYDKLLGQARELYERNVAYYQNFQQRTTRIVTPDTRLNESFAWAKIGVDKGLATNPYLGTGLLAGFRTSGDSERPGFAWFFGRDALWTSFALNAYGDFSATRIALEFLKKFQRADGKIPHEISQSAALVDWFNAYPYAWASADATPLYVIAHADYFNSTNDIEFLRANWDSILKAYRFTEATDTDKNNLVENTTFGHGWVEGGALYPPHEEIYMQGLWIEASLGLAALAKKLGDNETATRALQNAERTRAATEAKYWLESKGFYAYATKLPTDKSIIAEPGFNRARRQARLDALRDKVLYDEDTALPAVPLWWHLLQDERAQREIDHLGSAGIATDWGARILSNASELYDPLSYHYGSVWALFTGWSAMAAFAYGRAHVGLQALMANALLYKQNALGYTTELLSGDFCAPFGRSAHHQIWSEAMVVTPTIRGLFGAEISDAGRTIRFAPQFPADWDNAQLLGFSNGRSAFDFVYTRTRGYSIIEVKPQNGSASGSPHVSKGAADIKQQNDSALQSSNAPHLIIAPAFPLDARVRSVKVNGRNAKFELAREGDIQRAAVTIENSSSNARVEFFYDEGTDVYYKPPDLINGQTNSGLRILRSLADARALHLTLEGLGGRTYELGLRTAKQLGALDNTSGVTIKRNAENDSSIAVAFNGAPDVYIRREITIPLMPARK
jgi:glycogen debranching enzyme